MTLVNGFKDFCNKVGINLNEVYEARMENATIFSFAETSDENMNYNVMLILYDDNKSADVWVRKPITNLNILEKLNDLNLDYGIYTFAVSEDTLISKCSVDTNSDINVVLKKMMDMLKVARKEFKKFK
jgi:hypothetical protein